MGLILLFDNLPTLDWMDWCDVNTLHITFEEIEEVIIIRS